MSKSDALWVGLAALVLAALAFAVYRWRRRRRARHVLAQVRAYLAGRYESLPDPFHVHCSDDPLWPVLVSFVCPRTGSRHNLQFACWGPPPAFFLLAEVVGQRHESTTRGSSQPR
jgi:hypothetical protein